MKQFNATEKGAGNGFQTFQNADYTLRDYSSSIDFAGKKKKKRLEQEVAELMSQLCRVFADAKEGQILNLKTDNLSRSELRDFLKFGRFLLNASDDEVSTSESTLQELFMPHEKEELKILSPRSQFSSFNIINSTLFYLSSVNKVSYRDLTNRGDIPVHKKLQTETSSWWRNLSQEHIAVSMNEMHKALVLIESYPQAIFSEKKALSMCHFIAVVAKFGRLPANVS